MYSLPANARRVLFLEGNGTQYVDTGITPGDNEVEWEFCFDWLSASSTLSLFGSRQVSGYGSGSYAVFAMIGNKIRVDCTGKSAQATAALANPIIVRYDAISTTVNGTVFANNTKTACNYNLTIGSVNTAGTIPSSGLAPCRIRHCKIWKHGTLVRDYIPCRVGTAGYLFDKVSGRMFGNGDFVSGEDWTYKAGVIPNHMIPMGVRKAYPWDYRVAYFQSDGTATGFAIPKPIELNPNMVDTVDCRDAILGSFENGRIVVSAPASAESGDKKITGGTNIIGVGRYNNKWRPAGINAWPTQPTNTDLPLYENTPTMFEWYPGKVVCSVPSEAKTKDVPVSLGRPVINSSSKYMICCWDGPSAGTSGARFFCEYVMFSHPTYGFGWDLVPCIKNNTQFICDRITGTLYPKVGTGTIISGPRVADNYDPITNP